MAKKGGVQQLQTEINTNDELTKFLDRDGLIVFDVYIEWCGPCLAMIGSLKKIKLEQGGDDLHLAVVKCDKIDAFKRFRNKSEPTWLLASKGKLVNSAFGANVPHLVDLILRELDIERRTRSDPETSGRMYYELNEMTPIERKRFDAQLEIEQENERIEIESAHQRRIDYLTFVINKILQNASDMGVTILMPHVISRDLLKRLTEPADKCHLVAKDKKNVQILNEHLEILNLCEIDLMPKHVLDHIQNRDVFIVCWKITDGNGDGEKTADEYLNAFANLVWSEEEGASPILKGVSVVIETEMEVDDIDASTKDDADNAVPIEVENNETIIDKKEPDDAENQSDEVAQEQNGTENGEINGTDNDLPAGEQNSDAQKKINYGEEKAATVEEKKSNERTISVASIKVKNRIEVIIPPIWTPLDKRANALFIYLYFRSLTELYLPPDPPVEQPHLAMVFDAYKRREIMEAIEQHRDDILAYGYFTSDNCETAQLIANSTFNYHKNPPTIYDKLIVKVAKTANSAAIAALKAFGPNYVSKNTEIGKTECLVFFPPGYKNSSETGQVTPLPVDETQKKKKKKKRKAKHDSDEENEVDNALNNVAQAPADVETTEEPEDGTELDDEDSVDDEDSANEANDTENAPETTET